jgi:hypothetical protein
MPFAGLKSRVQAGEWYESSVAWREWNKTMSALI